MADEEEVKDTRSTYQKVEDAVNKKYEDYVAKKKELREKGAEEQHYYPIGPEQEVPVGQREPVATTQYEKPIGPQMPAYEKAERAINKKYDEAVEKRKRMAKQYSKPIGPQQPTPTKQYDHPIGPQQEIPIGPREPVPTTQYEKPIGPRQPLSRKIYTGMQKAEGILDRNIDFNAFGEDLSYLKEQAKSSARNIGLSEKQSARKYGDVQFPTLFGGSGGMFDTPERERKIRQVDLFATQEKYDPFTGKRIPLNRNPIRYDPNTGLKVDRKFTPVSEHKKEIAKNKMLIDIFESERHLTDYEKAERKSDRERVIGELEYGIQDISKKKQDKLGKIKESLINRIKAIDERYAQFKDERNAQNKIILKSGEIIRDPNSTPDEIKDARSKIELANEIKRRIASIEFRGKRNLKTEMEKILLEKSVLEEDLRKIPHKEKRDILDMKEKNKIVTGHDPLSLFSKPRGSTSVSEEMKRLRGLQKRKPKKLVYSYDLKTRDTFDLIGSPKQRREIPYNTRPMGVSNPVSTIREPVNQLSRLTSQKIIDPFGGISVKKTKPSKAKKPIVINVFGSLTASKRKKEPPLKKLFGGGFDLAPIKAKKAKPLKTSKKKRNVNDAFNLFGKPKKGGLF